MIEFLRRFNSRQQIQGAWYLPIETGPTPIPEPVRTTFVAYCAQCRMIRTFDQTITVDGYGKKMTTITCPSCKHTTRT